MRKVFLSMLALGLMCWHGYAQDNEASGDDKLLSFGAEFDVNSKYIWRGVVYEDNLVVQPTAWVAAHGLTLSVWNNHTSQPGGGWMHANEVDLEASYAKELTGLETEVRFGYYSYPTQEDSPPTGEMSVKLGVPFRGFSLATNQSLDVVRYPGSYFGDMELTFEHEMIGGLGLELSTSAGWASAEFNETYSGLRKTAFNLVSGGAAITCPLWGQVYAKPHVEWFHIMDSELAAWTKRDAVNVGGTLGIEW
jgi:hypothetical protein